MRKITNYPEDVKASILAKAMAPNGPNLVQLAKESNIPYATLYSWKKTMIKNSKVKTTEAPERPQDKSAESKLAAVIDTLGKTEEEQGTYCRANGIYTHNLVSWKNEILKALGGSSAKAKADKAENKQVKQKVKELERNLRRKEKALAEVSALLILKKKADLLWGEKEDV